MLTARLGPRSTANATLDAPRTARERPGSHEHAARPATGAPTNWRDRSIARHAKARARRAQLARRFPHDAPDGRARALAARLTAMGGTQRTPTEGSGARRATGTAQARREPVTEAASASMGRFGW